MGSRVRLKNFNSTCPWGNYLISHTLDSSIQKKKRLVAVRVKWDDPCKKLSSELWTFLILSYVFNLSSANEQTPWH